MTECPVVPWMQKNGLEQRDLAKRLGAPESSVSSYISGKRGFRLERFQKLSAVTGIPLGDLVKWSADAQRRSRRR